MTELNRKIFLQQCDKKCLIHCLFINMFASKWKASTFGSLKACKQDMTVVFNQI